MPPSIEDARLGVPVDDALAGERFLRQVGRRRPAPRSTANTVAALPDAAVRDAWARLSHYRTRVPKGVFIYPSHEAANRDQERWQLEAMLEASGAARNG